MVGLIKTVFEGGPKDVVEIIDVYDKIDPEVRNQLTSKLSSFGSSLTDIFGKSKSVISNLGGMLKTGELNLNDAKTRLMNALSGSRSDIQSLAQTAQRAIYGDIAGDNILSKASTVYNSIEMVMGNSRHVFGGDALSVRSTLSFISDITNTPVFNMLDLGAETALVNNIIGEVSRWGIPDLVDTIMADRSDEFRYDVFSRSSSDILYNSNHDMMHYYTQNGYGSALTSTIPDFGAQYIGSYQMPLGTTPDQYNTRREELVSIMANLDPNWATYIRKTTVGDVAAFDLRNISGLSPDAIQLLISESTYRDAALIASEYPTMDIRELIKTMYPGIAIN